MGKRLIVQHRGRGNRYQVPSHNWKGTARHPRRQSVTGEVVDLIHDPGHTAPLAKVHPGGEGSYTMLAHEGLQVGQRVNVGHGARPRVGNTVYLGTVPEGTQVYNIEKQPGDGGKFVRAGGCYAIVVSHGKRTTIKLPSGAFKTLDKTCRATIGRLAGGGRGEKPWLKAGTKHKAMRNRSPLHPRTSGVRMNACNHPHGSGRRRHVGKSSTVSRRAPPGRKVGSIAARRTGKRR